MKYLLIVASALMFATPAIAHKRHSHRYHSYWAIPSHMHHHCHKRSGICHFHTHNHGGKGNGHHGERFMHGHYPWIKFEYHHH